MEPTVKDGALAALTDDELAAVSYGRGWGWRAALPTLDPADPEDMGDAIFRGGRSLMARGLLDVGDGEPVLDESLAALVEIGAHGGVAVSAFTGDSALTYDPTGFAYLNYRSPGSPEVVVEIVDAVGLHRFGELDATEAGRALTELVTAVHDGTETNLGTVGDTLCLALPTAEPERRAVFAVRKGVVEAAVLAPTRAGELDLQPAGLPELLTAIGDVYRA